MSAPVAAESADHHPEELVAGAEPRSPPSRPCQHRELMTQQEIFGDQRLAVAHDCTDEVDEQKYIFEHRPNIMPPKVRSRPGRLLRPHRPLTAGARVDARVQRGGAPAVSGRAWRPGAAVRVGAACRLDSWRPLAENGLDLFLH